jgi:Ala-tRNA(Pro) deacylase
MLAPRLKKFLDDSHVAYKTINHTSAYTAQEIAERTHTPGGRLAKPVIVKADDKYIMLVEPADTRLDLKQLQKWLGAKTVTLASESEFRNWFPECELGAMPPFGNLYNMEVYLDDWLEKNDTIAFNAGSHEDLIEMSFKDFDRLVHPRKIKMH